VDGYSHALQEDYAAQLEATARDYIYRIRKGCVRMGRLIDDLLKLSRISRSAINRIPVDLSRLAGQVVENLRNSEPDREVTVEIEPGMGASADLTLSRSILENLLGNAWKFTKYTENPLIRFSSMNRDGSCIYCIRDNGAGFNMEYADKLFQAFQRLHGVDQFEGTGIGLASVQRVIALHNGKIWAEGEEGKGAAFYFTLGDQET
jgi:light-regulated signal transduction histidine kinase (bacteriophytochrome)